MAFGLALGVALAACFAMVLQLRHRGVISRAPRDSCKKLHEPNNGGAYIRGDAVTMGGLDIK